MPLKGKPTWRFQTFTNLGKTFFRICCIDTNTVSLQSFINLGKTFFQISRTDLILGEAFCIFIFFHFPDSGFFLY